MRSFAARASGIFTFVAVVMAARQGAAFCRTGTCSLPSNFTPTRGACQPPGTETCEFNNTTIRNIPLWWQSSCVGYNVQRDAGKHVSLDDVTTAVASAFGAWSNRSCPTNGTGSSRVTIDARDLGPVQCTEIGYHSDRPNQHVIVFRDSNWPHKTPDEQKNNKPSPTIALTTVSFDPNTGELFDADIEINSADHTLTLTDSPGSNVYDLESVLTHEAGHFLGIAHSPDTQAVMYFQDEGGSSRHRDLSADDVAAVCAVYPPSGLRPVDTHVAASGTIAASTCDPVPRHGLSVECAPAPSASSGCAVGVAARGRGDVALAALAALGLVAFGRRRVRRR